MKDKIKQLLRYPVIIPFFLFIFGYMLLDICTPDKLNDEYQNKALAQRPVFSMRALLSNQYTANYETYLKEQFAYRHEWMVAKSFLEQAQGKTENNGAVLGKDGYQFQKFFKLTDEKQLQRNTDALVKFAKRHPDQFYAMIVPSASLVLKDKLPAKAPFVDENAYLNSVFQDLTAVCHTIDLRDTLAAHNQEYIFYRTDHHWTTHGAYLAYRDFITAVEKEPVSEATDTALSAENFYGTNYNKSLSPFTVPDTISYYPALDAPMTLFAYDAESDTYIPDQELSLYNMEKLSQHDKYAMFLYSNNAFSRIQGNGTGRILIIKDSYANCFVPFLTQNYAQIDVLDLRSYGGNIDALCEENQYDTILALYNFQSFSSDKNIYKLNTQ